MLEYIRNIIIAGAACSLAVIALPQNVEKCGRYVRYLSSFIILAVILSPLKNISGIASSVKGSIGEIAASAEGELASTEENAVIGKTAENISAYIIKTCGERFGIDTSNVRVRLMLDEEDVENVIINEIKIYTKEHDRDVLDEAEVYFSELFGAGVFAFGP